MSDLKWDDHLPRSEAGTPLTEPSDAVQGNEDLAMEEAVSDRAEGEGTSADIIAIEGMTSMDLGTRQSSVGLVVGQPCDATICLNILLPYHSLSVTEAIKHPSGETGEDEGFTTARQTKEP